MREVNWLGHVMFARAKVQLSVGRSNDFNKRGQNEQFRSPQPSRILGNKTYKKLPSSDPAGP